jgi:peroxiredoxin
VTLTLIRNANKTTAQGQAIPASERLKKGTLAPSFSAQALDETTVTVEDYANKAVLFVFLALHCSVCEGILPSLVTIGQEMAEAELVLVSNSTVEESRRLAKKHALALPLLSAPQWENPFFPDCKVHSTPTYYLINAQWQIQATGIPYVSNPQWMQLVASLTQQTTTTV